MRLDKRFFSLLLFILLQSNWVWADGSSQANGIGSDSGGVTAAPSLSWSTIKSPSFFASLKPSVFFGKTVSYQVGTNDKFVLEAGPLASTFDIGDSNSTMAQRLLLPDDLSLLFGAHFKKDLGGSFVFEVMASGSYGMSTLRNFTSGSEFSIGAANAMGSCALTIPDLLQVGLRYRYRDNGKGFGQQDYLAAFKIHHTESTDFTLSADFSLASNADNKSVLEAQFHWYNSGDIIYATSDSVVSLSFVQSFGLSSPGHGSGPALTKSSDVANGAALASR